MTYDKLMIFLNITNILSNDYFDESKITFDMEINDCLVHMYFYMMMEDLEDKEKMWLIFTTKYNSLNDMQKEFVKNDFINIINAQDENNKVKKKGMINYE